MSGISKISRLVKFPEFLGHKKDNEEHEEKRRQRREEGWDKYADMIQDSVSIETTHETKTDIIVSKRGQDPQKLDKKGPPAPHVGDNIDLII